MSRTSRLLTTLIGVPALVLGLALPAVAHVTVNPGEAVQGSSTKLAFRVPTEEDANTVALKVTLPEAQPLPLVFVKPHPGWSYEVKKVRLDEPVIAYGQEFWEVVRTITWTADNRRSAIKPGEFDEFEVSVAPLPMADQMVFQAVQNYDNGIVKRWEPVLKLMPKPGTAPAIAPGSFVVRGAATQELQHSPGSQGGSSTGALTAGVLLAFTLGTTGLVLGVSARRRSRRPADGGR